LSFDNGAPINAAGQVAFIATIVGGTRVVRRVDANGLSVTLASAPSATLSSIEFFPPVLNDAGLVAFRGRDGTNRQAIFVADGTGVRTVVTRGDIVPSDLGNAWIDQNVPGDSAFSGAVAINANGDLAFAAALTPAGNNQVEWGTGLYVARAVVDVIFNDDFGG
jgi:hypothetical protein